MRFVILCTSFFIVGTTFAFQDGVVTDPDGYSNLRSEPTSTSEIVEKLIVGEVIRIDAREGDWMKVRTELGATGYIHQTRVSILYQFPEAKGQKNNEIYETGHAAARSGVNYPLALKYALGGRESAIQLFFWLAEHGEFDGAASEGLAADLADLLKKVGDQKFANLLSREPAATRAAVLDYLDFGLDTGLKKYPATTKLRPS